jgi:hypothetical protein
MLNDSAVTNPTAPDATISAFASIAILTDAPSPSSRDPVLMGASAWLTKLLHPWLL